MSKIRLGSVGAVLRPAEGGTTVEDAVELEQLGFPTIWLTGGELPDLKQVAAVVRATERVKVGTAILSVDRFGAGDVAELYSALEATDPGRLVVGLGGAHGPDPMRTLNDYLDRLDEVPLLPANARIMAALGPRMLDMARQRSAGALPVLVTPAYTAQARSRLGDETALVIDQLVVTEVDTEQARTAARRPLGFLGKVPAYQANFARMGFTDDEVADLDDRLVDELVPWGDPVTIADRVAAQLDAGADHVAVSPVADPAEPRSMEIWRDLAQYLLDL